MSAGGVFKLIANDGKKRLFCR